MTADASWMGIALEPLDALFCRAVRDVYSPLDASGALLFGGRFNPPGIAALYLAATPDLALRESTQSLTWAGFRAFAPRRVVCVATRLSRVLDLSVSENAALLGLSLEDLMSDWVQLGEESPTQAIGQHTFVEGVEAILFPSRLDPGERNLAVFRDNLLAASRLEVVSEDAARAH